MPHPTHRGGLPGAVTAGAREPAPITFIAGGQLRVGRHMSRRQALPLCRRLGWERPARGRIVVRALAALSRIVALGGDDRRVGAACGRRFPAHLRPRVPPVGGDGEPASPRRPAGSRAPVAQGSFSGERADEEVPRDPHKPFARWRFPGPRPRSRFTAARSAAAHGALGAPRYGRLGRSRSGAPPQFFVDPRSGRRRRRSVEPRPDPLAAQADRAPRDAARQARGVACRRRSSVARSTLAVRRSRWTT